MRQPLELVIFAVAVLLAHPVVAQGAGDGNDGPDGGGTSITTEVAPAIAVEPGVRYIGVNYSALQPYAATSTKVVAPGSGAYGTGGSLVAALDLPHGSYLYDMSVWGGGGSQVVLRQTTIGTYSWSTVIDLTLPAGTGLVTDTKRYLSGDVPALLPVDRSQNSFLVQAFSSSAAAATLDIRVGYIPATSGFVAIAPVRAYDSRISAYPQFGKLAPKSSRVVSVKDGHSAKGAVTLPDAVPAGAKAVAVNLIAMRTTNGNSLSMTAGDARARPNPVLNWTGANVSIAEGLVVQIDADRQVKVWSGAGAGSTDVVIDVMGYFLGL